MNTPKYKPALRYGLSRPSSSAKKISSLLTPSTSSSTPEPSSTTPSTSIINPTTPAVNKKVISSSFTPKTSLNSKFKKSVITKKKLEFVAQHYLEKEKLQNCIEHTNLEGLDIEALQMIVEEKRNKLEILKRFQTEKEDLIAVTQRWKEAGQAGIERLRKFTQEPMTDEKILDSFRIPHDAFL